MLNYQIRVK